MRAYSMDLRERVLRASDAGMKAADVAEKYDVSGSWVRLLKQRRRTTGEVAPRAQRYGRRPMLAPHLHHAPPPLRPRPQSHRALLREAESPRPRGPLPIHRDALAAPWGMPAALQRRRRPELLPPLRLHRCQTFMKTALV